MAKSSKKKKTVKKAQLSISVLYNEMMEQLVALEDDVTKTDNGNKAAGTRVRSAMMDVKKKADGIRKTVLEIRNTVKE